MNFFLSTDIIIGVNEAMRLIDSIRQLAISRPGIIYDANLAGSFYFQDVLKNITSAFENCVLYCNDFNGEQRMPILKRHRSFSGSISLTVLSQ